ncbi:MAG: hypothetical protein MdMp014T_0960 [Treponematales bacterium]
MRPFADKKGFIEALSRLSSCPGLSGASIAAGGLRPLWILRASRSDTEIALSKEERYRREVELINRNADRLNKEALDVLSYQACGRGIAGESGHEEGGTFTGST